MRKRKSNYENENHERWVVSYADFVTLLFAFFVVLYAVSEQDSEKGKKLEESVKKYLIKVGVVTTGGQPTVNEGDSENTPIEAPLKKYKRDQQDKSNSQNQVLTYLEETFLQKDLQNIIQDISEEEVGFKITIISSALFIEGDSRIKNSKSKILIKLGELFQSTPYRIFVESHAFDSQDNWLIGAKRSSTLVTYFVDKFSINKERFAAVSYGSSRPLLADNKENLPNNTRIDFLIVPDDSNYR